MTPNVQTSTGLSSSKLAPLDRAKQLAATLLSERSEASGALVARELHEVLRALDASDRHGFQRYLATKFQPDSAALRAAAERYLADGTAEAAATLARAADPPRQGLLRRINMAPGGTGALICAVKLPHGCAAVGSRAGAPVWGSRPALRLQPPPRR